VVTTVPGPKQMEARFGVRLASARDA
jgi:hypothetical protein